jgi:lipoate-protein ligase A
MALDEALLDAFEPAFETRPVLRLYRWSPAALSLGRFQPLAEVASVPDAIPRVRRISGGGALFHRADEVTYSIVAPYSAFDGRGPKVAYRAVHEAIRVGLESLGLALAPEPATGDEGGRCAPLCYDRATDYDLRAQVDRKLVGSAQRRRGAVFLQHGSIPVSRDPYSAGAISLEELLGRRPAPDEVAGAIARGVARVLRVELVPDEPSGTERARARALEDQRYARAEWTAER